jgi:hypothetical protein
LPTLVVELRGLLRGELARPSRRALAVLALLAAAVGALALWRLLRDPGTTVVAKGPPTFNFRHPDTLRSAPPRGDELVRFERRDHGRLLASVAVEPLSVPVRAGALREVARDELSALRRRFPGLRVADRERTRVNEVAGYTIAFRARRHPRVLGRVLLLREPVPGSRQGVRLLLLARPGDGVAEAGDVGRQGATKLPYRTFRFGTGTS